MPRAVRLNGRRSRARCLAAGRSKRRPFDRTPVLGDDSCVIPKRGQTVERPERPLPTPAPDPRRSGPTPAVTSATKCRAGRPTRCRAREKGNQEPGAFTYIHSVPRGTRQLDAAHAAPHHAYDPALLPNERLRQLPRGRSDHRDGQLPDLRIRPPDPLTRAAPATR